MPKESGVSAVAVVAAFAVLAVAGTGFLAWQSTEQLGRAQTELDAAKSGLNKARADLRQATQDLAVAAGQSLAPAREADSLLAALGTPADRARFTAVADSARQVVQRCAQERRQRDTAHADSARFGVR